MYQILKELLLGEEYTGDLTDRSYLQALELAKYLEGRYGPFGKTGLPIQDWSTHFPMALGGLVELLERAGATTVADARRVFDKLSAKMSQTSPDWERLAERLKSDEMSDEEEGDDDAEEE